MLIPPNIARPLIVLAVGVALTGCAAGSADDRPDGPAWLAAEAEPVTLTLDLESDNSASRTITPGGGTIAATAEDGTRFRLRIPEGALLSTTTITMTPVRSVKGLPLSGKGGYATVQLEPDGLQLMKPAVLSIRSKREIPRAEQVAFAYYGHGEDAHLYPLGADPSKIELQLLHFSGYGFGEAPSNDPGRQALQLAATPEARLAAKVAEAITREKQRDGPGMSQETFGQLESFFTDYYDAVLARILKNAETNDKMFACATEKLLSWIRQGMLLGLLDGKGQTADPELDQRVDAAARSSDIATRHFYNTASERAMRLCRDEHDLSFPVTLIAMVRQKMLTGVSDETEREMNELIDKMNAVSRRCMRFEVEFESMFDNKYSESSGVSYRLVAKVPFTDTVLVTDGTVIGEGPITHAEFRAEGNPMRTMFGAQSGGDLLLGATIRDAGSRDGVFRVLDFVYQPKPRRPTVDCAGKEVDEGKKKGADSRKKKAEDSTYFAIVIAPGLPKEVTHYTNHSVVTRIGGKTQWTVTAAEWADDWARWHAAEEIPVHGIEPVQGETQMVGGAYQIKLDSIAPGKWRALYIRQDTTGHVSERSVITVQHKP